MIEGCTGVGVAIASEAIDAIPTTGHLFANWLTSVCLYISVHKDSSFSLSFSLFSFLFVNFFLYFLFCIFLLVFSHLSFLARLFSRSLFFSFSDFVSLLFFLVFQLTAFSASCRL